MGKKSILFLLLVIAGLVTPGAAFAGSINVDVVDGNGDPVDEVYVGDEVTLIIDVITDDDDDVYAPDDLLMIDPEDCLYFDYENAVLVRNGVEYQNDPEDFNSDAESGFAETSAGPRYTHGFGITNNAVLQLRAPAIVTQAGEITVGYAIEFATSQDLSNTIWERLGSDQRTFTAVEDENENPDGNDDETEDTTDDGTDENTEDGTDENTEDGIEVTSSTPVSAENVVDRANNNTVNMQNTGAPVVGLLLAFLLVFSGLFSSMKKR